MRELFPSQESFLCCGLSGRRDGGGDGGERKGQVDVGSPSWLWARERRLFVRLDELAVSLWVCEGASRRADILALAYRGEDGEL